MVGRARGRNVVLAGALLGGMALPLAVVAGQAGASKNSHTVVISTTSVAGIGTVLTTSSGMTLYEYTVDPSNKASCTGACAKIWPPELIPKGDKLKGPKGLKGLSTIAVGHGKKQATFHRHALYRFVGDASKGQAKGQGVEHTWFAVLKSGASSNVQPAAAATTTTAPPAATTTQPKPTSTPTTTKKSSTPATTPPTTPSTAPPTTPPTSPPTTTPPPPPTTTPTTSPPPTTTPTTSGGGGYGY